jgi:subtilisin family serine protease
VKGFAASRSLLLEKRFRVLSEKLGQEYFLLSFVDDADAQEMAATIAASPEVEYATPNYRRELAATPNDTYYSSLWGMHNTGQTIGGVAGTVDADIDAPEAWCVSKGSSSIVVAVIDSGIDYNHPDLAANVWINPGETAGDGIDNDGNGYTDDIYGIDPAGSDGSETNPGDSDPMDGIGHGSHCSGTIGAVGNNALGVVGVNWNVRIMGLKFFGDYDGGGWDADAIECMEYLIDQKSRGQNVVVVNASWGGTSGGDYGALRDAIELVNNAGIVFCAAAGNGGSDGIGDNNETTHHYPSDFTLPGIISVAATDNQDALADFSNYGVTSVDLGAPGVDILSTVPGRYIPQAGDIFFDNMQGDASKWSTGGTNNSWAISTNIETYWGAPYPEAPSTPYFWSDSPSGNYVSNTNSWLMCNSNINLSSYVGQEVYLGISCGWNVGRSDHFYVEISNNGSAGPWTVLQDFTYDGYIYFWNSFVWPIPDSHKTANFRVRFRLVSGAANNGRGWVIDNVGIGTDITYGYEFWGGTSMATPHVTGAVALLASVFPGETVAQKKTRILNWGDAKASLSGKTVSGRRLNLYNSLTASLTPTPQSITVTAPNGGESWTAGTAHDITWTWAGTYPVGSVNIDYSINSGSSWTSVAAGTANDGIFSWSVPATPSSACLVRVQEADGCPSDISNAVFAIVAIETVSTPTTPAGPASGTAGTSYSYSTGGSVSSFGHSVQYLIDWGDSSDSGWLAVGTTSAAHSWAAAGSYSVRAMARCASHTAIVSAWSTVLTVTISTPTGGYYNSPARRLILPETTWAAASGSGTWVSELQLCDVSGGSTVQAYYNTGASRLGPFTLWNNGAGGALSSVRFANILETLDGLDGSAFVYYGTGGALELLTQDGSHLIQAAVRTYNGNVSRTFPALADVATNTAASGRSLVIPNISNNGFYRPSVVLFNAAAESATVEVKVIGASGAQVGATISRSLAGYQQNTIVDELRAMSYANADVTVTVTGGSGRVIASGQTAHFSSNDPAAHVAVQGAGSYANSPAARLLLPEVSWAAASGSGDWVSEVHVSDLSGGSVVTAYYNSGTNRRGPFTLWTNGGGAGGSATFANILQTLDELDTGAFTYYGTGGSLELLSQDGSHLLQASVRTFNGSYSRTFPGLLDREETTAASGRALLILNMSYNGFYRPSLVLFNPGADSVTVEVTVIGGNGSQVGAAISRTLAGYEQSTIVNELRVTPYENATVRVRVTGGAGRVIASGQTANNLSNDPAAHIAVQGQ